jgi:hypothetical protein
MKQKYYCHLVYILLFVVFFCLCGVVCAGVVEEGNSTDTLILSAPFGKSNNNNNNNEDHPMVLFDDELELPAIFSSLVVAETPIMLQNPESDYQH